MDAAAEILDAASGSLCLDLRFLTASVLSLERRIVPGEGLPVCDGTSVEFRSDSVVEGYLKDGNSPARDLAHCALHCILGHGSANADPLVDLAEDMLVEYVLDSLDTAHTSVPGRDDRMYACDRLVSLAGGPSPELMASVLGQESQWKIPRYQEMFRRDDHSRRGWADDGWSEMSKQAMVEAEGFAGNLEGRTGTLLSILRIRNRRRYDYREFLRKFVSRRALPREDPDSFDPIYYTYGLSVYGNMPLVDSSETSSCGSVSEFVIAIDTSGSALAGPIERFLEETMNVVRQCLPANGSRIHVVQCDDRVRSDDVVTCEADIKRLASGFALRGGGSTDFRPVFRYVSELIEKGDLKDLRGMIYFTDGMGTYPERRPGYDVAFVFCDPKAGNHTVPPWAMRLEVVPGDLTRD